jgi:hypothetical protein
MAFYSLDPVNMGVKVSATTTTLGTNDPELGSRAVFDGEDYTFVYNDGGEQISKGYFCVISGNTGYSVTVSSVTQVSPAFGVVKHATMATATYGWVLTRGFSDVKSEMASTAIAAGDNLCLADDGQVNVPVSAIGQLGPKVGFAVQATGSAGTAYAYVKCWG